jgi:hypothetical protein
MGDGTYTDRCRKQYPYRCPREMKTNIQNALQEDIADNELRRANVLVTDYFGEQRPIRQQTHFDFGEEARKSGNRKFVIIPLDEGQDIFVSEGGKLVRIALKKDRAFVGDADLLHCGSETPGTRLHFEFVPKTDKYEREVLTYFEEDLSYPDLK